MERELPRPQDLFAAEVQYWRLEPDAWRPVLERACEAGLPGVSSYVPWEVHEVEPGRFDFDGSTDPRKDLVRYLGLVKELGLRLAYRPGPFVCNEMDWGGHPRRIVTGEHDWYVLAADGTRAPGYRIARREGWQPSYLHPGYLDEVRRWFAAADGVAREFTAVRGGPIRTCNLDNELSYIVRDSMFGADYNACVVGPGGFYARWLAERYGDPGALPYARGARSFDDVEAPRELGADVETDLQRYFDWIECKERLLAEYLATLSRMHLDCGLEGIHFYTNLNPHRPEGVPTDLRRYAEATGGLVGYDFYRSPWLGYSGYSSMARVLRLMGATLPVVWSAEFMGGWWFTDMSGNRVPRGHTEFMALAALANGCRAVSWFMFHDRDCWGDAPVSELGHGRENLGALRAVVAHAHVVEAWDELRPACDLAVAWCRPYMWHCHLGDPNPCADGDLHRGEPTLWGCRAGDAVNEYEGLFRIMQQAGYTAACVDLPEGAGALAAHRLVWLAGEPFIDEATAAALGDYVRGGGVLVISLDWPRVDLRGRPIQFLGLAGPPPEAADGRRTAALGAGRVVHAPGTLAGAEPGEEDPAEVARVRALLKLLVGPPAVEVSTPPVEWRTWLPGGGAGWKEEPRNLVDALLHEGGGARVLYVVSIHERAVRATVRFGALRPARLEEIGGARATLAVREGRAEVDVDRKSVRAFMVVE